MSGRSSLPTWFIRLSDWQSRQSSRFSSGGALARWRKPVLMAGSCLCALGLGAGLFFATNRVVGPCPAFAAGGEADALAEPPALEAETVAAVSEPEEERHAPGWAEEDGGTRYWFPDGTYAQGYTEIGGEGYYFDRLGFMQTGLVSDADGTRYFGEDGAMRTGEIFLDGVTYSFGEDGFMEGRVQIDVPVILQNPELPNGCEITSLTEVLQYLGFQVTHTEMAGYLPCEPITYIGGVAPTADPEGAYIGDPATTSGWYCFEGPVVEAANGYLRDQGSPLHAHAVSGADEEELLSYLQDGQPVIVWVTQQLADVRYTGYTWVLPDGESIHPYGGLHCVVLSGMDVEAGTVTLADPIYGEWEAELGRFMEIYEGMGSRAVVVG